MNRFQNTQTSLSRPPKFKWKPKHPENGVRSRSARDRKLVNLLHRPKRWSEGWTEKWRGKVSEVKSGGWKGGRLSWLPILWAAGPIFPLCNASPLNPTLNYNPLGKWVSGRIATPSRPKIIKFCKVAERMIEERRGVFCWKMKSEMTFGTLIGTWIRGAPSPFDPAWKISSRTIRLKVLTMIMPVVVKKSL